MKKLRDKGEDSIKIDSSEEKTYWTGKKPESKIGFCANFNSQASEARIIKLVERKRLPQKVVSKIAMIKLMQKEDMPSTIEQLTKFV